MDEHARSDYETKSQTIRAELKKWETSWAKTHDGKKPSRDDIKQNPDIAQKYKSYNKIRDILSGKLPAAKPATSPSRKRKSSSSTSAHAVPAQTPSKRLRTTPSATRTAHLPTHLAGTATTPSLNRKLFLSPGSARVPTPTSIGPTPQRDGRVLGLFDLLSGSEETPSRARTADLLHPSEAATAAPSEPAATPQKKAASSFSLHATPGPDPRSGSTTTPAAGRRHGRTPMSTSKRALLDNFLLFTPLKSRDGNAEGGTTSSFAARVGIATTTTTAAVATDKENGLLPLASTPKGPRQQQQPPLSASKSLFATPAFLRRDRAATAAGPEGADADADEPAERPQVRPLRLPRRGTLARGLSSLVAGLRTLEEERLDEEMEAMREMEMEEMGGGPVVPKEKGRGGGREDVEGEVGADGHAAAAEAVEVGDSQQAGPPTRPALLGGFDDLDALDSEADEQQLDRGQPLRVFKKKGQKRTTRRVNMRPTRARRPAAAAQLSGEESGEDAEVVPETQVGATDGPDGEEEFLEALSGSDFEDGEEVPKKKTKAAKKGGKGKAKEGGEDEKEKEGAIKKAGRKVKATAHANFKRLKLRNYGAKGGPGVNSRFRRKR